MDKTAEDLERELASLQAELSKLQGERPVKIVRPLLVIPTPQGLQIPNTCSGERLGNYVAAYGWPKQHDSYKHP